MMLFKSTTAQGGCCAHPLCGGCQFIIPKVVNRMFTDLETKGTLRTAPETFNLASKLHDHDVLNAEFVRTFRSVDFPGRAFLSRHEAVLKRSGTQVVAISRLPRKQTSTNIYHATSANWVDLYGFRSKSDRVRYLSPWAFLMWWEPVRLLPPCHSERYQWTRWIGEGHSFYLKHIGKDDPPELRPGEHFVVSEDYVSSLPAATRDRILLYPNLPALRHFRHQWLLRKRCRPLTPSPEASPLPHKMHSPSERAIICSVYLRPWVLAPELSCVSVPLLRDLDVVHSVRRVRLYQKQPAHEARNFRLAWKTYVRGRVVSRHAAKIIQNFLMAVCAQGRNHDKEDDDDADTTHNVDEEPVGTVTVNRIHDIIDHNLSAQSTEELDGLSKRVAATVKLGKSLWTSGGVHEVTRPAPLNTAEPGREPDTPLDTSQHQRRQRIEQKPHVKLSFPDLEDGAAFGAWFSKLRASPEPPYREQETVLRNVYNRILFEERELHFGSVNGSDEEPMRALIHGFPGAGKSKVIHWLRDLFEQVFGWKHREEFMCLAPLNTMAALIKGNTVHSWGEVPINAGQAAARSSKRYSDRDVTSMFTKCSSLRWIILDEVEAVGCEVLSVLDTNIRTAVTAKNTYKMRALSHTPDGSAKQRQQRVWGGVNFIAFGDFWQIPPVRQTPIYANPFKMHQQAALRMLANFWSAGHDSITHLFELPVNMRSGADTWFSALIHECRHGALTERMYNFLHGYPTDVAGSWSPKTNKCECKQEACDSLAVLTWPMMQPQHIHWEAAVQLECDICKMERKRRARVLDLSREDKPHADPAFAEAPYIHPFNVPKYMAAALRSIQFARAKKRQILWVGSALANACMARSTRGQNSTNWWFQIPFHVSDRHA